MGRGKGHRSLKLIDACTEILEEIQPATVRAVCYRLFTMGLIDSMSKNETNRVGRQLVDAREAGTIPWSWIVDETRAVESVSTWADPEKFADDVTRAYRRDKWAAQPVRIEVWSEKGTVRGMLAPVLGTYEVPFRVMHGFASATVIQEIARESLTSARPLVALYVGDWDPSGLYMSAVDLPFRVREYRWLLGAKDADAARALSSAFRNLRADRDSDPSMVLSYLDQRVGDAPPPPQIMRVALTEADVAALGGEVSFPLETKGDDPRHDWYLDSGHARAATGDECDDEAEARCWELDALSPVILRERVEAAIVARLDRVAWDRYVEAEQIERESITRIVRKFGELAAMPGGAR